LDAIDGRQVEASGGKKKISSARGSKGRDGMKRGRVEAAQVDGSHASGPLTFRFPDTRRGSRSSLLICYLWQISCAFSLLECLLRRRRRRRLRFEFFLRLMDRWIDRIARSSCVSFPEQTTSSSSSSSFLLLLLSFFFFFFFFNLNLQLWISINFRICPSPFSLLFVSSR
jgi:hypothetical protein